MARHAVVVAVRWRYVKHSQHNPGLPGAPPQYEYALNGGGLTSDGAYHIVYV